MAVSTPGLETHGEFQSCAPQYRYSEEYWNDECYAMSEVHGDVSVRDLTCMASKVNFAERKD